MALLLFTGEFLTCCLIHLVAKRIMESELSSLKDEVKALRAEVGRLTGMTLLSLPTVSC